SAACDDEDGGHLAFRDHEQIYPHQDLDRGTLLLPFGARPAPPFGLSQRVYRCAGNKAALSTSHEVAARAAKAVVRSVSLGYGVRGEPALSRRQTAAKCETAAR